MQFNTLISFPLIFATVLMFGSVSEIYFLLFIFAFIVLCLIFRLLILQETFLHLLDSDIIWILRISWTISFAFCQVLSVSPCLSLYILTSSKSYVSFPSEFDIKAISCVWFMSLCCLYPPEIKPAMSSSSLNIIFPYKWNKSSGKMHLLLTTFSLFVYPLDSFSIHILLVCSRWKLWIT